MALGATFTVNSRNVEILFKNLPIQIRTAVPNAAYNYLNKIVVPNLQKQLIADGTATPERVKAGKRIFAKRLSKFRSVVKMPISLKHLDSMRPHFVALKRGRKIRAWAKKYYGSMVRSRRSKVMFGPMGGILYQEDGFKSQLYVTPHPFITQALRNSRRRLKQTLRSGLRKAFRRSR